MNIVCPLPAALVDIPTQDCPFIFDQIVRQAFQLAGQSSFTEATIKVLATWTPLLASSDATKVVTSPIFAELVIPQSEALTTGGNDNTTFNGIPQYNGEGAVTVTYQISNLSPETKTALESLTAFSLAGATGKSRLTTFLFNKDGKIISDNHKGFPIYNFRISSVGSEGFNTPNKHAVSFTLMPGWDRNAVISEPTDFDPLTI